jgi:hypothetical protein
MKPVADLAGLISLLLILSAVLGGLACFALFGWTAWPDRAERVRRLLETAPSRCLYIGGCNLGVYVIVFLLVVRHPGGRLIALLLAAWTLTQCMAGLPALAMLIGERIARMAERPLSRMACVLAGMIVIGGSCVLPIVGWVTALMLVMATLGAAILGRSPTPPPTPG